MKLIIGLGNPGQEYVSTRHNVGFEIVDKIRNDWNFSQWEFNKKFNAEISKGSCEPSIANCELLLAKPTTYMNLSGEAVQAILTFYKLTSDDIIVIHDDLDITVGKYKIATNSSSAGHHGIENIIKKLGTQKFKRIRIGIEEEVANKPPCRLGAPDYVLEKFTEEDKKKIAAIEPAILDELKKIL
jgi:PTH1 family peptidyl-tRNA hydrolase